MKEPTSFTFVLTQDQVRKLHKLLKEQEFLFREVPYAHFGAKKEKLTVNAYTSGKCLIQGKGAKHFIEFTLEPEVLQEVRLGYEEVLDPEMFSPHLGIDESGKGDFFGPLVIGGAYVDESLARRLLDLGVRDSKRITSDQKILEMEKSIKEILGNRWEVVAVQPQRYNELYQSFANLNKLLAWGHAQVIENLLKKIPSCPRALSDQFGHSRLIESALQERGKRIELIQRTKAEKDVAVAAASILARAQFISSLRRLGETVGRSLPKGASALVLKAACELGQKQGVEHLKKLAKVHFKTFDQAMKINAENISALKK